jgi:trk system potassium uptake protein TrkH
MTSYSSLRFPLGSIMLGLAALMLAPCAYAWYLDSPDLPAFLASAVVAALAGALMVSGGGGLPRLRAREMFLLTTLAWLTVCTLGALPFVLSNTVGSVTDAVFESVSGVTTTGSTVLTGLDAMPRDILLWRSMMQWIGGIGIIALGAAVLPFLRIGGMRLFRTESSDLSEKSLPQTRNVLLRLSCVYVVITLACAVAYMLAGMSVFDAINHAMTTVSTGGYSTHDQSIAYFRSSAIEMIAVAFMIIAAIPFMLFLPALQRRRVRVLSDGQVRSMLIAYAAVVMLLTAWRLQVTDTAVLTALRDSVFSVVSIGTTTGYVSADYGRWGGFAIVVFFFLTFVGGCSGSTSGGIKIFRFRIAFSMFRETVQRLLHPNAVSSHAIDGHHIPDEIVASVMAFSLAFACTVSIVAVILAALGNDFVTSFSAAATATANVGPGVGDMIGPHTTFASLSMPSKWIMCVAMLLGRLEIFTVLILLTPAFWRQ